MRQVMIPGIRAAVIGWMALAACQQAGAEWRAVASGANVTAYTDTAASQHKNGIATMQVLLDYNKQPFDGNNLPYLSLTMHSQYRCIDGRYRVLALASHAENMGRGERPYFTDEPTAWELPGPRTIQEELLKHACGTKVVK